MSFSSFQKNVSGTLLQANMAVENPPFWWYLLGKMGIFVGYVSFREGNQNPGYLLYIRDYTTQVVLGLQ